MPQDILQVGPLQWGRINHRASFTAFFTVGPIVVEGPELKETPKVGTLVIADWKNNLEYNNSATDESADSDGRIEMRVPSATLMQAIEGFANAGAEVLVVSDRAHTFEMQLDVSGLKDAAIYMRKCVDAQGLGL